MDFSRIDFNTYNKPPFYPQYLCREDTKKLVSYDDPQLAELDRVIDKMSDQYDLDRAREIFLDRLGKLKDEPRNANNDELYRLMIRLRILLDTTNGSVNDIIKVVKFLYSSEVVHIEQNYPAALTILHDGEGPQIDFNSIISQVIVAGVGFDTRELFFFTDEVEIGDELRIIVRRKDAENFGCPLKFNGAAKFDGKTLNNKVVAHGKFDGSHRFNGDINFTGKSEIANQFRPTPPFKFCSGIYDILDVTFKDGNFVDKHHAKLYFDGSVKFDGGSKFCGLSQYSMNDPAMNYIIGKPDIDNANKITDSLETSAGISVEENTKKLLRFDGRWKFNGKAQFTDDYADQLVAESGVGEMVDKVEMNDTAFVGMRKHHFFNGSYRFNGSIRFDGMALIPLG